MWFGFYENAFGDARAYEELGRRPDAPLADSRRRSSGCDQVVLYDRQGDDWHALAPTAPQPKRPGDPGTLPTFWEIAALLRWALGRGGLRTSRTGSASRRAKGFTPAGSPTCADAGGRLIDFSARRRAPARPRSRLRQHARSPHRPGPRRRRSPAVVWRAARPGSATGSGTRTARSDSRRPRPAAVLHDVRHAASDRRGHRRGRRPGARLRRDQR